ncbi:helix-turn-helix domain-containing protein [Bacterioplanoides sp.]|uniref:helix-turn-helix transcriptional regulator n=1 Tax=Bacterioplanoides sp. TaxID=2066072 RepID=UPI003B59D9AE
MSQELKQLKFPAIYSQLARDFIAASPRLSRMNIPLQRAYQLLGIPSHSLTNPHATLSGHNVQLLMAVGRMMADKSLPFSVQLGQVFKEDTLGVLGLALVNSATSRQALETFQQYAFIYSPGFDFHFEEQQEFAEITLTPLVQFDRNVERTMLELIFCAFAFYIRSSGLSIEMRYSLPYRLGKHKTEFETFTQGSLQEMASRPAIRFPRSALEQPLKSPNTAMHALYMEQLKQQAESTRDHESFSLRTRRTIEQFARQGIFFSREQLAQEMAVSVRTLNRKLKEDGLSFQPLLDQARFNIARRLLIDTQKTTKQIAFECGIQNPAVFCRAFKKWSGKTPGEFRDNSTSPVIDPSEQG